LPCRLPRDQEDEMDVRSTARAENVVRRVVAERPEAAFVFVFGSGCCEGTAPHLFADYALTTANEPVGTVAGETVYADGNVRRLYEGRTVTLDAEEDALADGFSAEIPLGYRFVLKRS
jgi:uncharacterized protein (DUF779 family)